MSSPISAFQGPYRFLSNFYPCIVPYEFVNYPSAEHAFVAAKTLDPAMRIRIREVTSPGEVKRLGRTLRLRPDWDNIRLAEMEKIVRSKFYSHPWLMCQLLMTKNSELIEGNWWGDKFWGVCEGVGENHLGKILMKIRAEAQSNWPMSGEIVR